MPSAIFYALFVALVAGICSSQQECLFPTNDDLVQVISEIFRTGDSPTPPTVTLLRFRPVCLAFGRQQDRYRLVSVVVEYTCSGNTNCPSGTVVEQIESQCNDGVWSNVVLGSTENTRLVTPDADFSTTTREDCSLCLSPELANSVVGVTTDNVTHCLACDPACDEGLMRCFGIGPDECCNFLNNSMCVDECPSPLINNTDNECVCRVGTIENNCSEIIDCGPLDDPAYGEVSLSSTTVNSTATYSCNTGFTLTGDDMRTCLETGFWSGSEPICCISVVDCGYPPALDYGRLTVSPPTSTTLGSIVTYECNDGYVFDECSEMSRICLKTGYWSYEFIECVVDCDVPPALTCPCNDDSCMDECYGDFFFEESSRTTRTSPKSRDQSNEDIQYLEKGNNEGKNDSGGSTIYLSLAVVMGSQLCGVMALK